MPTQSYISPAKINITLKVLEKRPDGYHNLSSLMQTIDLVDTLHFDWEGQNQLTCTDATIPIDKTNLVNKAIDLFRRKTGWKECVSVHLEKRIPAQAGLGGGSSNAATTLWALNERAGKIATITQLMDWSSEIGSDIPFFFSEGTALCEGRGEKVSSVQPTPMEPFWILKPDIGLSTAEVYKNYDPKSSSTEKEWFNDLEIYAFAIKPELYFIKQVLLHYSFSKVMMTGSGSAFICVGLKGNLPNYPKASLFEVRTLNRAPEKWYGQ